MGKMIDLALEDGEFAKVQATVYGVWAVHRTFRGCGFSVTHVPTGLSLNSLAAELTERDAVNIARRLDQVVPSSLSHADLQEWSHVIQAIVGGVLGG